MNFKAGKISKGAILLVVVVAYFILMGVKNSKGENGINSQLLKDVTVVSDGKINSANEGKLVLVTGKISFDESVKFEEIDYNFNSFKVERTVYDYVKESSDSTPDWIERDKPKTEAASSYTFADADDYYDYSGDYEAVDVYNEPFKPAITSDNLFTYTKTVPVKVGEFVLGEEGIETVNVNKALVNKNLTVCGLEFDGMYYSTPKTGDNPKVGDVGVEYRYYDIADGAMTVLAQQKGNSFVPYQIEKTEIYNVYSSDVNSIDTLKTKLQKTTKKNLVLRIVFALIILGFGSLLIFGNRKNKKDNNTEKTES